MRTFIALATLSIFCACSDGSASAEPDDAATDSGSDHGTEQASSGDESDEPSPSDTEPGTGEGPTSVADDDSSSSTGAEPTGCDDALPAGAPPTLIVDGQSIVQVDVQSIDAELRFDTSTQTASAVATLRFAMGPEAGLPAFDLRQTIETATLDGTSLGSDEFPFFQPNADADSRLRALARTLEPCTEHELVLTNALLDPDATGGQAPAFGSGRVEFYFDLFDLYPGRYLEQWIPAPLEHDPFELDLQVSVEGTTQAHTLITNGTATARGENAWSITYDGPVYSSSPLVAISPTSSIRSSTTELSLPDGQTLAVEVYVGRSFIDLEGYVADIEAALAWTNLELGEYVHGDRYVFMNRSSSNGMEYDGAGVGVPDLVEHEVFHAWVARGLRPLTGRDAWFDEGWTIFYTEGEFMSEPLTLDDPPQLLASDDPWQRHTPSASYGVGARIFATLAQEVGLDPLRAMLREIYVRYAGQTITTETLEHELYCAMGSELVRTVFHRFVYGRDDATPIAPLPECPAAHPPV